MVRGAVRALIVPTPLSTLWMSLQNQLREGDDGGGVGGVTGDGGLFQTILNQLIADGEVTGSLRGGNAMWTPACGEQQQQIAGCAAAALWKS